MCLAFSLSEAILLRSLLEDIFMVAKKNKLEDGLLP
jgi:hypothetical protein